MEGGRRVSLCCQCLMCVVLVMVQCSPYVKESVFGGVTTTSKHLSSTYSKIKGNFLVKALKFAREENVI